MYLKIDIVTWCDEFVWFMAQFFSCCLGMDEEIKKAPALEECRSICEIDWTQCHLLGEFPTHLFLKAPIQCSETPTIKEKKEAAERVLSNYNPDAFICVPRTPEDEFSTINMAMYANEGFVRIECMVGKVWVVYHPTTYRTYLVFVLANDKIYSVFKLTEVVDKKTPREFKICRDASGQLEWKSTSLDIYMSWGDNTGTLFEHEIPDYISLQDRELDKILSPCENKACARVDKSLLYDACFSHGGIAAPRALLSRKSPSGHAKKGAPVIKSKLVRECESEGTLPINRSKRILVLKNGFSEEPFMMSMLMTTSDTDRCFELFTSSFFIIEKIIAGTRVNSNVHFHDIMDAHCFELQNLYYKPIFNTTKYESLDIYSGNKFWHTGAIYIAKSKTTKELNLIVGFRHMSSFENHKQKYSIVFELKQLLVCVISDSCLGAALGFRTDTDTGTGTGKDMITIVFPEKSVLSNFAKCIECGVGIKVLNKSDVA